MTLTQQRGPQQGQGVVQAGLPRPALRRYLPLYGRLQLRVLGAGQELEAEQHSVHASLRARPVQVTLASVRSREVTVRSPRGHLEEVHLPPGQAAGLALPALHLLQVEVSEALWLVPLGEVLLPGKGQLLVLGELDTLGLPKLLRELCVWVVSSKVPP